MIQTLVYSDHESMSVRAAERIEQQLRYKPGSLLCLATGHTPMLSYDMLAARVLSEPELGREVRVVKLDEWGGLAMDDPASCEVFLQTSLILPLGWHDRYLAFDGQASDFDNECARIARVLEAEGPIDLCVLGLGLNGHLGFNEPAAYLQPHAHVANLSHTSLTHTMLTQTATRPSCGLTLGIADLLQSRQILLLVSGAAKRPVVERLLSGRITTEFPASMLLTHPHATLMCDEAAWPEI
ncbi:MAG: 6-phosphogluconolactonase [Pirellulales bacterium]